MKFINNFLDHKNTPIFLSGLIFVFSLLTLYNFKQVEAAIKASTDATAFTKRMTQSSDDLTNYARYYVTTLDERWKKEFNRVLDIRNGIIEDSDGIKKSFKDRVKEQNFTKDEIDLILKAEYLSNNLAKLEVESFKLTDQARNELSTNNNPEYINGLSIKAKGMMFGEDYTKSKNDIMLTTQQFYNLVVHRMNSSYKQSMTFAWVSIIITNLSLILIIMGALNRPSTKVKETIKKPRTVTRTAKRSK